jgi:DnaJ family protein C protein 28
MSFDRVIEEQIRRAQEEGKFDDLPGKGQPLKLDENPFEDPAWAMANQMLKNQGFRPEWLEADLALRQELEQARRDLRRTRDWRVAQLQALAGRPDASAAEPRQWVADEWSLAQTRFRARLQQINQSIFSLNLKVPSTRFQRLRLDVETELARIVEGRDA